MVADLRVLHVVNTFGFGGGVERHLLDLSAGQVALGHDVSVAYLKATTDAPAYGRRMADLGVRVTDLRDRAALPLAGAARLTRLIHSMRPDVVHSHLPRADLASAIASWMPFGRCRRITTVHNDEMFFRRAGWRQMLSATYRSFPLVIAITAAVAQSLESELRVPPGRMVVVPYGISAWPTTTSGQLRRDIGVGATTPLIGTIGRLAPQKGIDVLLRALAMLPAEVQLVVVGPDEGEGTALRRVAAQLGLARRVTFTGYRPDTREILPDFDVFCLPSRWEGLGMVVLEAGIARVPVVASDIGPVSEILGGNGALVPVDEPATLAAALAAALADREGARKLAGALRARVLAEFSIAQMLNRTEAAYRRLLETEPEAPS